jgi:hypothetical protein
MALAFRISPKRLTTNIQIILPTYLLVLKPAGLLLASLSQPIIALYLQRKLETQFSNKSC